MDPDLSPILPFYYKGAEQTEIMLAFQHKILEKNKLKEWTEDNVPAGNLLEKIRRRKESDPQLDPDPLARGTDPHQNVTDPQHWF
jgi:hypothetical protein